MQLNVRHGCCSLIYAGLLLTSSVWATTLTQKSGDLWADNINHSATITLASNQHINQQALAAQKTPMDCPADEQVFSSTQGKFRLLICTPVSSDQANNNQLENQSQWGQLRFIQQSTQGQETTTYWPIELDWLSGWVGGAGLQFWGDHFMSLDIGGERGGILLIANWNGTEFVISEYLYMTGDEDSMALSWDTSGFVVDTVPDGTRRLVMQETASTSSIPGQFIQETLSCTIQSSDHPKPLHTLKLAVDTVGLVTGISYGSSWTMPGTTPFRCSVQAARDDGETAWEDNPDGTIVIAFDGEGIARDGDAMPANLDYVRILRHKKDYVVRMDVDTALFCESSGIMAKQLILNKSMTTCLEAQM